MTDAEKKEYQKKYYQEYVKKGKKKGRKKGKKKAASSTLLGVSSAGLSPEGAIEAAAIKDTLKKEMNAALAKAKTPEEQLAIRKEYSKKAMEQIQALKKDPKYARVSTAKQKATTKSSTGSKSSGSAKSSGSSGSSRSSGSTKSSQNVQQATAVQQPVVSTTQPTQTTANTKNEQLQAISDHIQEISKTLANLTPDQKEVVKNQLNDILDNLKTKLKERLESLAG